MLVLFTHAYMNNMTSSSDDSRHRGLQLKENIDGLV